MLRYAILFFVISACGSAPQTFSGDDDAASNDGGAIVIDADPDTPDADLTTPDGASPPDAIPSGCAPVIVYINSGHDTYYPGFENPLAYRSAILSEAFEASPLEPELLAELLAYLEEKLAAFDPIIVTERPADTVPYATIVVGPSWPDGGVWNEPAMPVAGEWCQQVFYRRTAFVGFENPLMYDFRKKNVLQAVGRFAGLGETATTCMARSAPWDTCSFADGVAQLDSWCPQDQQDEIALLTHMFSCNGAPMGG